MAECSSLTEECGGESEYAFIAMWQGKPELYDVTSASKAPPFWVRTNSGATIDIVNTLDWPIICHQPMIYIYYTMSMPPTLSKTGQQWRSKCLINIKILCRQLRQIKSP